MRQALFLDAYFVFLLAVTGQPHASLLTTSPWDAGKQHAGWINKNGDPRHLRHPNRLRYRTDAILTKARIFYLKNKGLSEEQKQTKAGLENELRRLERRKRWSPSRSSLYNSYPQFTTNPVRFLQRKMQKLTSNVATLNSNIQSLSKFRARTNSRLEALEAAMSALNNDQRSSSRIRSNIPFNEEQEETLDTLQNTVRELQRDMEDLRRAVIHSGDPDSAPKHHDPSLPGMSSPSNYPMDISSVAQHDLNGGHPVDVMDEVRNQASRLDAHDAMLRKSSIDITSLQHQLVRVIMKNQRQDASVRFLQAMYTNSSSVIRPANNPPPPNSPGFSVDMQPMPTSSDVMQMKTKLNSHSEKLQRLREDLTASRSCCDNFDMLRSKTTMLNELIHEARHRADESAQVSQGNRRKMEEMTGKMDNQRLVIKRLQQAIISQQRFSSRVSQELQEGIRSQAQQINATLHGSVAEQLGSITDKLTSAQSLMQSEIVELRLQVDDARVLQEEQIRNLADSNMVTEKLEESLAELTAQTRENDTDLFQRMSSNERLLVSSVRLLEDAREESARQRRTFENKFKKVDRSILRLRGDMEQKELSSNSPSELDSEMFETVAFLNSSYHQLRTAVQRQSNRNSRLNSYIERLNQAERKLWERITRLQEAADESNFQTNNASTSIRRMMTSDFSSLRRTVATRFNALTQNINNLAMTFEDVATEQANLDESVSSLAAESEKRLNVLDTKTRHLMESQEIIDTSQRRLELEIDALYSSFNSSVSTMFLDRQEDIALLEGNWQAQIDSLLLRTFVVERNVSDHTERILALSRKTSRIRRNVAGVRINVNLLENKLNVMDLDVSDMAQNVDDVNNRMAAINTSLVKYFKMAVTNEMDIQFAKTSLDDNRKSLLRLVNITRTEIEGLMDGQLRFTEESRRTLGDINTKLERGEQKVNSLRKTLSEVQNQQNDRLSPLEKLNGTLRAEIRLCLDQVRNAEGGVSELRQISSSIRSSVDLNTRALTEHRKLHRNMSDLSDSVFDVINEQGQALDTVKNVVVQLNESLAEGKEHIDDAISSQIERHMREVRGWRFIMRNFTGIIQRVLSDSINQGIKMASIRLRQRELMESVDNHAASIDLLNHETARDRALLASVEVNSDENTRQIANLALHIRNHESTIDMLDMMTYRLVDAVNVLNSSIATEASKTENLRRWLQTDRSLLSDLSDLAALLQQEFNHNKLNVWESLTDLMHVQDELQSRDLAFNTSIEALDLLAEDSMNQLASLKVEVEMLEARFDIAADTMKMIAELERNVTALTSNLTDVQRSSSVSSDISSQLANDIGRLFGSFSTLEDQVLSLHKTNSYQHEHFDELSTSLQSEIVSQKLQILSIIDNVTAVQAACKEQLPNVTLLLDDIRDSVTENEKAIRNVGEQEWAIRLRLDSVLDKVEQHNNSIEMLSSSADKHSRTLAFIHETNANKGEILKGLQYTVSGHNRLLQELQTAKWEINSRISELTVRTGDAEEQINLVDAKVRSSLSNRKANAVDADAQKKIRHLESSVGSVRARVSLLESDQFYTVNMTNRLLEEAEKHALQIKELNKTDVYMQMRQLLASLVSSLAAQQSKLYEVNQTLSLKVNAITKGIRDFQLAYDTSGRLMEKYSNEMKIMDINVTYHIDYFASSINYLRQIVAETSEAVLENAERIQALNESAIFMTFSSMLANQYRDGFPDNATADPFSDYSESDYEPRSAAKSTSYDYYVEDGASTEYELTPARDPVKPLAVASVQSEYEYDGDLRLEDILDGTADKELIQRRVKSLMDPSSDGYNEQEDDDYYEDEVPFPDIES